MLRYLTILSVCFVLCTLTCADQPTKCAANQVSVEYDLEFNTSENETAHVQLKLSGNSGKPIRAALACFENCRLEFETAAVSQAQEPRYRSTVNVFQAVAPGREDIIFRPRLTGPIDVPVSAEVRSEFQVRKLQVTVRQSQ